MIITAREASIISSKALNTNNLFLKKEIRQLRRIERLIVRESKKGRFGLEYYSYVYDSVIDVLKKQGYTVKDCGTYDYDRFVICWNKES